MTTAQPHVTKRNGQLFPRFLFKYFLAVCKTTSWFFVVVQYKKTSPSQTMPQAPKCPACSQPVFANEAYMAADRTPFHVTCVKCFQCKKALSPADINEHEKQLFCRVCYENGFTPKVSYKLNK